MSSSPSRASSRSAFLDSSAFYALADPRDSMNRTAVRIAQRLHSERWRLITTNFIRAEAHALLLNRLGHAVADRFLRESAGATLVRVTPDDEEQALDLIRRYRDKDFTITDATSFVVMERLGVSQAFSFDDDFRQYGLSLLQPE
jgi:predicted nucleic acid-binding protein